MENNTQSRILYVEDDMTLAFVTSDQLQLQGYQIIHAANGKEALELARQDQFHMYILDVMLPEMDGFDLATEIRKFDQESPILFLTAKSMKEDRIKGLRLGADDYIIKPFSIEELILRIEIFMKRRKINTATSKNWYTLGKYQFDYANLCLIYQGEERILTQKEAEVLKMLADHPNQVLQRAAILEKLWGENDYFMGRSMDVFISRLRKYLSDDPTLKIDNIHGVGFKFIIPK